jgi:hypothetical protein
LFQIDLLNFWKGEPYEELRISTLFSALDCYLNPDNGLCDSLKSFGRANTKNVTPRLGHCGRPQIRPACSPALAGDGLAGCRRD